MEAFPGSVLALATERGALWVFFSPHNIKQATTTGWGRAH